MTRGRPYKKNDQAWVEQKNWSVVRRLVGYDRYSTKAAFRALQELYALIRRYVNFFQPSRRLVSKERVGAKVIKRFDVAQTPYRRLEAAGVLTDAQHQCLEDEYQRLNPVHLRAQIDQSLDALWKLADRRSSGRVGDAITVGDPDPLGPVGELSTIPQRPERDKKERKEKAATITDAIDG